MADGVVIKITGDDGAYREVLERIGDTTEQEMKQAGKSVQPVEDAYTSAGKKAERFGQKMSAAGRDAKKAGNDTKTAGQDAEQAGKDAEKAGKKAKSSGDDAKKGGKGWEAFGSMAKTAGSLTLKGIAAVGTGAGAIATAFTATAESTRETRTAMAKLETGFTTSGFAAQDATDTYNELYGVLGDTDRATEASAHLAKLVDNEKDLQTWTDICTGVYATFGDSLPIEGLTEAANETAKTGTVTGVLADALNWAGVSEEDFNKKLAACTSEQERQKLITSTLNGLYEEQAGKYRELNADVIAANKAQADLTAAIAEVGAVAEPIMTTLKQLAADLLKEMLPFIELIGSGLQGVLNGTEGATEKLAEGLGGLLTAILTKATEVLPQVSEIVIQIVQTLVQGLTEKAEAIGETASDIINTLVQGCIDLLPMLFDLALKLLVSLANGIVEQLPVLIPAIIDLVINLCDTLLDNLPMILEAWRGIWTGIADGIREALPLLLDYLPELVQGMLDVLFSELPKFIEASTGIITTLIDGLTEALPKLIEYLPEIVMNVVSTLIENAPKLIASGFAWITSLVEGIGKALPLTIDAIEQIISKIIKQFREIDWGTVGSNIIQGIVDGVKKAANALVQALKDVGEQALSSIEKFFGIASPSRVMRDAVGKQLPAGAAVGVEENADVLEESMEKMGASALDSAKKSMQTENMEFSQPVIVSMLKNFHHAIQMPAATLAASSQSLIGRMDTAQIAAAVKNGMENADISVGGSIETHVDLDGRRLAAAQTPFVSRNVGAGVMRKRRGIT